MASQEQELLKSFDEKIEWGSQIIEKLKPLEQVDGVDKLIRRIQQEVKFLKKVHAAGNEKKEHLQSTNLIHLNALVERFLSANDQISVLKPFKYESTKLEVDIVCNGGSSWVKVIARNPKALTLISRGNAEYGQKSVFHQAEAYLKCAKNHPHMYKPPEVTLYFACGIELPLAQKLESALGIKVEGHKIDVVNESDIHDESFLSESESEESGDSNVCDIIDSKSNTDSSSTSILNLDVSTLLVYVSNMTNGHANFLYAEPLLNQLADWERSRPMKPILDELFHDKTLVVCRTAYNNFTDIVNVIGGENEKIRAKELISRLKIIEDIPEGRIMQLNIGGKVKERSRIVFSTGENLKSITVSANEGFVRAARMQGIECMVFLHETRSLSEAKELVSLDKESS